VRQAWRKVWWIELARQEVIGQPIEGPLATDVVSPRRPAPCADNNRSRRLKLDD